MRVILIRQTKNTGDRTLEGSPAGRHFFFGFLLHLRIARFHWLILHAYWPLLCFAHFHWVDLHAYDLSIKRDYPLGACCLQLSFLYHGQTHHRKDLQKGEKWISYIGEIWIRKFCDSLWMRFAIIRKIDLFAKMRTRRKITAIIKPFQL